MIADTKMMAVVRKRGCSRIIPASSKPLRSGMHTSISTRAISCLSRYSNAWRADDAFRRFSPISSSTASWLSNLDCWSSTSRMLTRSDAFMLAVQPHAQRGEQLLDVDRLREIVGRAGLQAFLTVALHGFGRQRQNGQPPRLGLRANRLDGFVVVLART